MDIELLYFEGCPSWQQALASLRAALPDVDVTLIPVADQLAAEALRFVGSPTLRVDGVDLFPIGTADFALSCRVYATPDGLRGWPSPEMVRAALAEREPASGRTHASSIT